MRRSVFSWREDALRIFIYILILLLLALAGGAGFFYQYRYLPMATDYARIKAGIPEFDRAKSELRKYRDRDSWIRPLIETLKAGLDKEVQTKNAEIIAADNGSVIINISERLLYTPGSVTFANDSRERLFNIASLLKSSSSLKEKQIMIGNVTESVPPQGRGKKKTPGREARDLSAARSLALVKYLEKNGVAPELLVACGYPGKQPDQGFTIKGHKAVIVISSFPKRTSEGAESTTRPADQAKGSLQAPPPASDKPAGIPIKPVKPAPPKSQ